jgi:predicted kinase
MFKAIFITGGPGSGKDIAIREGIAESRIVELNASQAFDYLMDKKKLSEKSKDFRLEAIRNRGPLLVNCSADNLDHITQIKEELEELGYNTMMVYVDTTDSVSKQRNQGLKRTISEDVRREKWSKSQQNKVHYYKMFEDFNLFVNNNSNIETIEESITDVYDHTKEFLDKDIVNEIANDWLLMNGRIDLDEAFSSVVNDDVARCKHGKLLIDNNCTFCQMQRKAGKIDDVRDGDVKSNSDYIFKTYEDSNPTLKVSPAPKIPSFRKDKETDKAKKSRWFNLPSGAMRSTGLGREFDTRQQGTVYPMSGMGDVTYREDVEYKYKNEGLAEKPLKKFNSFRSFVGEAIDDPGANDMGVAGTEGGATNKEPMQSYKDQGRNVGITIKKNKKRGA